MPIVQLNILEGRGPEQKAAAIARVTEALVEVLQVQPAQVRVLITEYPSGHWGVGGAAIGSAPHG